jgi:hypothetical protein
MRARLRSPLHRTGHTALDFVRFEEYLQRSQGERETYDTRVDETTIDHDLLSADEVDDIEDRLYKHYSESDELFYTFWGFHVLDFDALYDVVSGVLEVRRRGRLPILGPKDSFMVLLHWLRTGASTDRIAQSLQLCAATLDRRLREFITAVVQAPLTTDQDLPMCGFVVDATIQNRGRPSGVWEQARCRRLSLGGLTT